ncbi:MAG: NUDIX domain-containing protein [Rothia sp. (in: high G+C Gram-positive bacteria)]|uniref:NUDIX hydrolase n=1 Tax=Rothia sp. (in: high G+C Gram-positive bacteria) TaxID=1885016 RepID=UPI0026E0F59A|nr:NUDIX domain-containing protein [Rothia sp. (in: high G+C Gram-positive bacteria)]MDO5750298.1 NUDIX domain-containing protein [Rothia sp. (in: high G+C Gram-positive bacteria)]
MPTPKYILDLREHIGHDYLWLPGATAVIRRESDRKILLVRRADTGALTPVTGIVDPGESPALTCLREAQEEANVHIRVEHLVQVKADPAMEFSNGDRCQFLDHTFLCTYLEGEACVNDEESTSVIWADMSDPVQRAQLSPRMLDRIDAALNYNGHCRFGLEEEPPVYSD